MPNINIIRSAPTSNAERKLAAQDRATGETVPGATHEELEELRAKLAAASSQQGTVGTKFNQFQGTPAPQTESTNPIETVQNFIRGLFKG